MTLAEKFLDKILQHHNLMNHLAFTPIELQVAVVIILESIYLLNRLDLINK